MFTGHEKQREIFKRAINSGRLSHAYILTGIEGIGKKLFALNAVKAIFCERGSFFAPCSCSSCLQVDMGSRPDFYFLSGEELTMEKMREVAEAAAMTPLTGKWKAFVFDKAEVLSTNQIAAGNALLKTLEEPGDFSIFFLITSKLDLVLPTIKSRCGIMDFSPLSSGEIKTIVAELRPEARFLDRAIKVSGGSAGRTLAILDSSAADIADILASGEYSKFISAVAGLKDVETFRLVVDFVYPLVLERYKLTGRYSYSRLGQYMLDILKRLNYNINADLLKADFASKVTEVFSETI